MAEVKCCLRQNDEIEHHTKNMSEIRRKAQFKNWLFAAIVLVVILSFREKSGRHFCVSNECAFLVTAAKLILHCIQIYVFAAVPRLTRAEEVVSSPLKARLNGFNICPTFVQQTLNGCWANVGQILNGVFKRLQHHSTFPKILYGCWMKV